MRNDQRADDQLRPVTVERGFQPHAYASVLITMGGTQVSCAVTLEKSVPPFLKDSGQGWITAEYGMLPCSTNSRMQREAAKGRSGRTYEIQRLIGRSLRTMVDLTTLGEVSLRVDCDVLKADGGTRTASITGAALALQDAFNRLLAEGVITALPAVLPVAAISVGVVAGKVLLDLNYEEDSAAEVDANFVMTADGRWVEAQSTAEGNPFSPEEFSQMAGLARKGIDELLGLWGK
ncbi:MAG: ribonuclease PH [Desulfobulbaceae bacterium]|nr:ribonuclease PH [Desulfobulbaceae bacterium]HIJ79735.1 ribonuclease PH [Deltaproteobacteria bacterium]